METTSYLHPFKGGDLIALLPGIKHLYETSGKKARIYQRLGMPSYDILTPKEQCMGIAMFSALKPLIESQDYIERYLPWEGEIVDIDVTPSRDSEVVGLPYGSIHHWAWALIPEMQCNLFVPWLYAEPHPDLAYRDKIIINRTARYHNRYITYFFLKKYQDQLLFAGLKQEWEAFCGEFKLEISLLPQKNLLETARIIRASKFVLGSQSLIWHIADAMKTLRLLEACPDYPNTWPTGSDGYFFLHQKSLEILFEKLTQ